MTPAVSVVMTAYNREAFIGEAIESVLAQRVTNFELIVVDDASTDGTVAAARRYLQDPRVRLVVNERNLGDYPNRNYGASLVRAEFFKFHDSDDVLYPHALEVMLTGLKALPHAAFALSSGRGWAGVRCPMELSPRLAYEREFLGPGLFHVGPACALFRTAAFRELGGFPDFGAASDYVFWLRACARVNVALVPGDLFWYREHAGQELHTARAARDYARASGEAWLALTGDQCPLDGSGVERARRNWTYIVARGAWRQLKAGRARQAAQIITGSRLRTTDWMRYLRKPNRSTVAGLVPTAR